jgi:alpha-ketoglutarate-dependent taurine dioxygenase
VATVVRDPGADLQARRLRIGAYGVKVGPVGHLYEERRRLAALEWQSFTTRPVGATVGAEIDGLALSGDLSDDVIAELRHALCEYKVLFFRDQPLDAATHVAFARRFGELEIPPFIPANTEQPELVRFEKSAEVGGYENGWHADVTWRECPSMGAVLHAVSVPPSGGDTLFCDMAAVYDSLDDELRDRIDALTAIHDYAQVFGHQISDADKDVMRAKFPPVEHPVVRTHPETGRRTLFVNRFFTSRIVGLDPAESSALIHELCREADYPEYQCRFRWETDSVAFWDNRAVQHYAVSDYWPDVRIVERASIIGDRPR